ncbi:hypothetical protein Y032_0232g3063 [Ancylostoma ceylanicum]|nr:hypothetical protein Y032_0232g3063 [Ancylostoma ceylanicum]
MATHVQQQTPPVEPTKAPSSLPCTPTKVPVRSKSKRKKRKSSQLVKKDTTKESKEVVSKEGKASPTNSTKIVRGHGKTSQPETAKTNHQRVTTPTRETKEMEKSSLQSSGVTKGGEDLDSGTSQFSAFLSKSKDARLVWLLRILEKGVGYLVRRYRDNMRYKSSSATTIASNANLAKNRYEDIRCIDATRVVLKGGPSDYIHANWITLADGRRFICSQAEPGILSSTGIKQNIRLQGPMQSTVGDFWHMIIQENCRTVIMLCKLVEDEKEKCAKYFPQSSEGSLTFGSTKVSLIKKTVSEHGYTASTWKVQDRERQFTMRHLQCTSWPDQSAPRNSLEVIGIHKEILKVPRENPIVVHCSAGVGRTCTLIGEMIFILIFG